MIAVKVMFIGRAKGKCVLTGLCPRKIQNRHELSNAMNANKSIKKQIVYLKVIFVTNCKDFVSFYFLKHLFDNINFLN